MVSQFVQSKVFPAGGWFFEEDRVPGSNCFDRGQRSDGVFVDLKRRYSSQPTPDAQVGIVAVNFIQRHYTGNAIQILDLLAGLQDSLDELLL